MLELDLRKLLAADLDPAMRKVVKKIEENQYSVVGILNKPRAKPSTFLVSSQLMTYLLSAENVYSRVIVDPAYTELKSELTRLRNLCSGLLAELKAKLGADHAVSTNLLSLLTNDQSNDITFIEAEQDSAHALGQSIQSTTILEQALIQAKGQEIG